MSYDSARFLVVVVNRLRHATMRGRTMSMHHRYRMVLLSSLCSRRSTSLLLVLLDATRCDTSHDEAMAHESVNRSPLCLASPAELPLAGSSRRSPGEEVVVDR